MTHITQHDETFAGFKTKLRSYKDTEKMRAAATEDNVMKACMQQQHKGRPADSGDWGTERAAVDLACFKCGLKGHLARACQRKLWYSHCRSSTHQDTTCRRRQC